MRLGTFGSQKKLVLQLGHDIVVAMHVAAVYVCSVHNCVEYSTFNWFTDNCEFAILTGFQYPIFASPIVGNAFCAC